MKKILVLIISLFLLSCETLYNEQYTRTGGVMHLDSYATISTAIGEATRACEIYNKKVTDVNYLGPWGYKKQFSYKCI
jgi:hypothetical protein